MDDNDLNSILNDEPTTETTPTETEEAKEARLRDERGRFASASDPGDETPEAPAPEAAPPAAQQEAEPGHIPVAALRDERQKRQQLEAQLQQYETYFSQLQQPPQQPAEVPDMYTDPEGYTRWVAEQVEQRIMGQVQQYGSQVETTNLARVSELLARQRYTDYDQTVAAAVEANKANPFIATQVAQAEDPAEAAYRIGKNILAAQQLGTAEIPSRDALKNELRAELMAELGLSSTPKAPSSLASEGSVASRSGPAWAGPPSLDDLLR